MKISKPEDDRQYRTVIAEREKVHRDLDAAAEKMTKGRRLADAAANPYLEPDLKRKAAKEADQMMADARAKIDAGRRRLREIEPILNNARSGACRRICDAIKGDWNAQARRYLVSRLKREGDEIAAVAALAPARDRLSALRIGLRGLVLPGALLPAEQGHAVLRKDVAAALAAGILKRSDVPQQVRDVWGM